MVNGWYFSPSNGGQTSGLNDSGVSYFEADPIRSIAKETLQDSIDARYAGEGNVIVKFSLLNVSLNKIPDYKNLYKSFEMGAKRWHHHEDTRSFFENGLKILRNGYIPVLAIQDYQTTGLSKVGDRTTGGWYTLVSASGVTEKSSADGGSFGIGKNAPFAASALRTVLYSTKNRENQIGFQGVARIPTILNEEKEDTQGIGYYYNLSTFCPVKNKEEIIDLFQRDSYGTGKFIIGFNDELDWEKRLIEEIVSSYLIAIHREGLEVHVNGFIINKSSLPKVIDMIKKFNPNSLALQYYEVLHSSMSKEFKKKFETDEKTKEAVTLQLLAKDGFKKRVGLHRSTGMKVFDKGHFHTPIDFSGVCIIEGVRLNAILRETEPPTHDKWDPKRYKKDKKYAEKLISEINKWINKCTKELLNSSTQKRIEIKGIEEILPDLGEGKATTIELKKDALKDKVRKVSKKKKQIRRREGALLPSSSGGNAKKSKNDREGKSKEDPKLSQKKSKQKAIISKINVFCTKPKEQIYSIMFSPKTSGEVMFEVKAVGENGKVTSVDILSAQLGDNKIPVTENVIGPMNISVESEEYLEIKIDNINRLALEVNLI